MVSIPQPKLFGLPDSYFVVSIAIIVLLVGSTRINVTAEVNISSYPIILRSDVRNLAGTKRPRHDDDARSDTPPSPIRDEPLSLKVAPPASPSEATPTPPPAQPPAPPALASPRGDPASEDDEPRPSKAARRDADDEDERAGASPPASAAADAAKLTSMETLVRLFPVRKVQVLETVLLRCGGDVLRAIQTLLYALPPATSAPSPTHATPAAPHHLAHHENNNNHEQPHHQPPSLPHHHHHHHAHQRSSPPRSPELRHHDLLQDSAALRASAFAPLTPPSLARFPYPPPHALMGLPYPPFLPPRPEYYPPLNLSSHTASLLAAHHSSPPPRDLSSSPTSQPDPDTE
ncbi:protein expanded-like [Penaeus chinensis]|uniref:protein expanded-like n=1 Tax=Penaeus chinensis TaxID=139456 RepID=UPI001FB83595|nr:protein expanded-like [Penaeus chinensis]